MAKQKLYDVLKKYNANHVQDKDIQHENEELLKDFETFNSLEQDKVEELIGSVKENATRGWNTTVQYKKDEIDKAVDAVNKEIATRPRSPSQEEIDAATKKAESRKKIVNNFKRAAIQVRGNIEKEKALEGKKTTFADITFRATNNQKEREESFRVFSAAGHIDEARKMLFEGDHPMTVTPRFLKAMEAQQAAMRPDKDGNIPDSPGLKLLYEKQLKVELDKSMVGKQATKKTIKELAEKINPGKIDEVTVNGTPILTYVALNNPTIIDRVARVEGISDKNRNEALVAVANRSRDRGDYNAALDLVASGAEANVADLNVAKDAMPAQEASIKKLVELSTLSAGKQEKARSNPDLRQQAIELHDKGNSLSTRDKAKSQMQDIKSGTAYVAKGAAKGTVYVAKGAAKGAVYLAKGAAKGVAVVGAGAGAGLAYGGIKLTKGILHTPQAIVAATSLTVGTVAVATYYNSAKAFNNVKKLGGHIKGALHAPIEAARKVDLMLERKKTDQYMNTMITKEFKELYEEGKKEITVDKKDKKGYAEAKKDLKARLDADKADRKRELAEMNKDHLDRTSKLIRANFKDSKTGLTITDKKKRETLIENELKKINDEKLAFFDKLFRGQENYESIARQTDILADHKSVPVQSLDDLKNRLDEKGSNRDTVEAFIDRFKELTKEEQVPAALQAMETNIKIQQERQKDYQVLATEANQVTEAAMKATKSMSAGIVRVEKNKANDKTVIDSYQASWDATVDFAKGVYRANNIPWQALKGAVKGKPKENIVTLADIDFAPDGPRIREEGFQMMDPIDQRPTKPAPSPYSKDDDEMSVSSKGSYRSVSTSSRDDDEMSVSSVSYRSGSSSASDLSYNSEAESLSDKGTKPVSLKGHPNPLSRDRADSIDGGLTSGDDSASDKSGSKGSGVSNPIKKFVKMLPKLRQSSMKDSDVKGSPTSPAAVNRAVDQNKGKGNSGIGV